jgi:hypothetical protein
MAFGKRGLGRQVVAVRIGVGCVGWQQRQHFPSIHERAVELPAQTSQAALMSTLFGCELLLVMLARALCRGFYLRANALV